MLAAAHALELDRDVVAHVRAAAVRAERRERALQLRRALSALRRAAIRLVTHPSFARVLLLVIVFNSVAMGMSDFGNVYHGAGGERGSAGARVIDDWKRQLTLEKRHTGKASRAEAVVNGRLALLQRMLDDLTLASWTGVFAGADWHERECWEMYGISFDGHPSLRHIYLPSGFEGNPLRKDYPLLARRLKPWPGIVDVEQMPGDDDESGDAS